MDYVSILLAGGFIVGAIIGATATVLFYWIVRHRPPAMQWIYVALFCALVMGSAAVQTGETKFSQAMLIILVGSAALVASARAITLIEAGKTIELQSHWGGLGGGLGGWRLSPATSLLLLALVFAGMAVSVVVSLQQPIKSSASGEVADDKGRAKPGSDSGAGAAPDKTSKPPSTGK